MLSLLKVNLFHPIQNKIILAYLFMFSSSDLTPISIVHEPKVRLVAERGVITVSVVGGCVELRLHICWDHPTLAICVLLLTLCTSLSSGWKDLHYLQSEPCCWYGSGGQWRCACARGGTPAPACCPATIAIVGTKAYLFGSGGDLAAAAGQPAVARDDRAGVASLRSACGNESEKMWLRKDFVM